MTEQEVTVYEYDEKKRFVRAKDFGSRAEARVYMLTKQYELPTHDFQMYVFFIQH